MRKATKQMRDAQPAIRESKEEFKKRINSSEWARQMIIQRDELIIRLLSGGE